MPNKNRLQAPGNLLAERNSSARLGPCGASIYVSYFVETPHEFAHTAETAANRDAYARYISDIPAWVIAVGIGAALARLLGAALLVARRRHAYPVYVVSTALFLAIMFHAFVIADVSSVMSAQHIAVEIVFLGLSVYAIWFSRRNRSFGLLK